VRALTNDVLAALGLLTRLPLPKHKTPVANLARSVWAYPLVGAAIGALSAFVWFAAQSAGLAPMLSAGLALGAQILLTGALHEDGLADFADGVGGGRDRSKKLEIMRDSRTGTYGVLALILIVGLRWGGIADLSPSTIFVGLVCAATLGRLAIVLLLAILPPARNDGLGALVANPPWLAVAAALIFGVGIAVAILPTISTAFAIMAIAGIVGLVALLARKQIGGYTGDVLGAGEQLAQTVVLMTFAVLL